MPCSSEIIAVICRAVSYFFHIVMTRNMMHPLNRSASITTVLHMEATTAMIAELPVGALAVLLEMALVSSTEPLKQWGASPSIPERKG